MSKAKYFQGAANRDNNEPLFTAILDRYHIEYEKGTPGAGYDLLVQVQPMELWEIKNPGQPPSKQKLTAAEQSKKKYCAAMGIPYRVLMYTDQAVDALVASLGKKQKG